MKSSGPRPALRLHANLPLLIGAFIFIALGPALLLYPTFRTLPAPRFTPPGSKGEENIRDLSCLRELPKIDRSFTPETAEAFRRSIDALMDEADSLDPAAFEMGIAKAVALANNGHTNLLGAARGLSLNSVPIRLAWFAEGPYVVEADAQLRDLLGARVLSMGGRHIDDLCRILRPYVGGTEGFSREFMPFLLISPEALHAAGILPSSSRAGYEFLLPDGTRHSRTIPARPAPANGPAPEGSLRSDLRMIHWPRRDMSPVRVRGDGREWVHVLDGRPVPAYLTRPDSYYWHAFLQAPESLYVQINVNLNEPGKKPLDEYLRDVLDEAAAIRPKYAIVDLRFDTGGNYPLTAAFSRSLPGLIPEDGRIFIITSANTFSAGLITAAWLSYYSGGKGRIVGEPVGDRAQFWAEGQVSTLPHSGLRVRHAATYHDWEHGASIATMFVTYPFNYFFSVPAGDLSPALPVVQSFSDYVSGQDTALNVIKAAIPAKN